MPYFSHDVIAQIGTPPGRGAVGAIRVSGEETWEILGRVTRGLEGRLAGAPTRAVHECRFLVELPARRRGVGGSPLPCPARAFLMPAPASYTRENVAEIHLPGSPALLKAALATLVKNGARAAAPGEFTFRAFRNGRLTLGQAEAVEEIIRAGGARERRQALSRLGDAGANRAAEWRERLADIAAGVEAALDFSEEELREDVAAGLAAMIGELAAAGAGAARAERDVSSGLPHVALVGLANAGKSSLMNALAGEAASLVSDRPSTTRDSLRREVCWDSTRFMLSDNPGFHPEGGGGDRAAARAFASLGGEDVACWVTDGSRRLDADDETFAGRLSGPVVAVVNKCDLPRLTGPEEIAELASRRGVAVAAVCETSAATGRGVAELRGLIVRAAASLASPGIWSRREALELAAAAECCRAAAAELSGPGRLELAAEDLRRASAAFSRVLGEGYAEETLGRIFSRFCIGK